MSGMDFAAEGLLDGLEGEDREIRVRLLESLEQAGFGLQELKEAAAEDRLALLPVERLLSGKYSARELEAQTGLPADVLLRIRRALGLPEGDPSAKLFCQADVEAARSIQTFLQAGFRLEAIAEFARVVGESMARIAGASGIVFAETFLEPGANEHEIAWRFADLAENLTPVLEPVLVAAYRAHLLDNVRRVTLTRAELATGQVAAEQEVAVCFADLVGFTRLGSELETQSLGDVIGTFGQLAADVADGEVRLVKTIGDAAMLVSRDPAPLVQAALSLVEQVERADLPALRAGIAYGPTIPRSGDLYGHAVNLASRVTGIARPGSVLCTKEVRDQAQDFDWSFAGRHRLKGVAESVPLFRAHSTPALPEDAEREPVQAGAASTAGPATRRRADRRRR